VSVVTE